MTLSEAKKRANKKWDRDNMTCFTVKVRRTYADEIREICSREGVAPATVMRAALDRFIDEHRTSAEE